jgi:hypothetical protein
MKDEVMKDNPAMQYRNNVAAHALLIMLSAVIAFLGLMMLAQLTRSDLYAAHNIPPNAGWHSAGDSHDQNKLNQSPIKVLSADKLRSLLGSQALSGARFSARSPAIRLPTPPP